MPSKNIEVMRGLTEEDIFEERLVINDSYVDNLENLYGIPQPTVSILLYIFDNLTQCSVRKVIDFLEAIPEAIGIDGKDLSAVHWRFLKDILQNLPTFDSETVNLITPVIEGMQLLIDGKEWKEKNECEHAAFCAVDSYSAISTCATYHAGNAAYHATNSDDPAYAASNAAYAHRYSASFHTYNAEIERQAAVLLCLLREAEAPNQQNDKNDV